MNNPDLEEFAEWHVGVAPLFQSWDRYSMWLPQRRTDGSPYYTLSKFPYWVDPDELERQAKLFDKTPGTRRYVRYAASPSNTGKTASAIPLFLANGNLNYYLPIAHANNANRNFQLMKLPDQRKGSLQAIGAAYMVKVVSTLLNDLPTVDPDAGNIEATELELSDLEVGGKVCDWDDSRKKLEGIFNEYFGPDAKVMVHVDEHRRMYQFEEDKKSEEERPHISRGALTALANPKQAKVYATYVEPLSSIHPVGTTGTCRYPIALPYLGVRYMIEDVNETIEKSEVLQSDRSIAKLPLHSTIEHLSGDTKRAFATFYFRLGYACHNWLGGIQVWSQDSDPDPDLL